jgi:hypothetical protein
LVLQGLAQKQSTGGSFSVPKWCSVHLSNFPPQSEEGRDGELERRHVHRSSSLVPFACEGRHGASESIQPARLANAAAPTHHVNIRRLAPRCNSLLSDSSSPQSTVRCCRGRRAQHTGRSGRGLVIVRSGKIPISSTFCRANCSTGAATDA